MGDHHPAGVLPGPAPGLAEDGLVRRVPAVDLVPAEVGEADPVDPVGGPAAERLRERADVVLRVGAAVRAEREQLHQLAPVVLVDRVAAVGDPVEEHQHRRVGRDRARHARERPEPVRAEQVRLLEHELRRPDGVVRRRPPVVEHEREPLDELVARPHEPVEPVERVAIPGAVHVERLAVDGRLRPVHRRDTGRPGERHHGRLEVERRERVGLARAGAEAGAPQQPLGLGTAERPSEYSDRRLDRLQPRRGRRRRRCGRRGRGRRRDDQRGRMGPARREHRLVLAPPALADAHALAVPVDDPRALDVVAALAALALALADFRHGLSVGMRRRDLSGRHVGQDVRLDCGPMETVGADAVVPPRPTRRSALRAWALRLRPRVTAGRGVVVGRGVRVRAGRGARVAIGSGAALGDGARIEASGGDAAGRARHGARRAGLARGHGARRPRVRRRRLGAGRGRGRARRPRRGSRRTRSRSAARVSGRAPWSPPTRSSTGRSGGRRATGDRERR